MKKVYYVEPVTLPDINAHAIQISNSLGIFSKYCSIKVISFKKNKTLFNCKKHYAFKRPNIFNKIMPLGVFYLLSKIKKIKIKKDSFLFTRNALLACLLKKQFKQTILELHDIPSIRDGFFHFILFKFWLELLPLYFLRKSKINYVTISNGLKKDLHKKFKISKNKIKVLPDAVDLKKFDIETTKKQARKSVKISLNKKILVYVGSFQDWKGYNTLLKASTKFNKEILLVMIGGSPSEVKLEKSKYKNVLFLGYQPNDKIPKYLKAADMLVIPNSGKFKISSSYTSPLKLFEYMASKRPIISSNLPSIKEIVSKKEVLFIEPDNYKDLAEKVNYLSREDALQKQLSINAFEHVKKFTWKNRIKEILKLMK